MPTSSLNCIRDAISRLINAQLKTLHNHNTSQVVRDRCNELASGFAIAQTEEETEGFFAPANHQLFSR